MTTSEIGSSEKQAQHKCKANIDKDVIPKGIFEIYTSYMGS